MQLSKKMLERIIAVSDPEREDSPAALASAAAAMEVLTAPPEEKDRPAGSTNSNLIAPRARAAPVMPVGARQFDRRRATRMPLGDRGRICLDRDKALGLWDTVMLQDISTAGISLLSSQWLSQGEGFELCLRDRAGAPIQLRCVVRRCERGGMGGVSYLVGATFEALLHDGGADGAVIGDACGGSFPDETESAATAPNTAPPAEGERSGKFAGLLRNLRMPSLGNLFGRPDDYSTSRIGQFKGRPSAPQRDTQP